MDVKEGGCSGEERTEENTGVTQVLGGQYMLAE